MEDAFDFQNMDVSRELASIEFGIDELDEVNVLEGLQTPSPSRSLDFGSLQPNMPNEDHQQHGGGDVEVESSLTESGESQNKEANVEAAEPTKNPELTTEGGRGKSACVGSSAFCEKPTSLPLCNVAVSVDSFTQLIASPQPPILTAITQPNPDLTTSPEGLVSPGTGASLQAQELNYPNLLSSQNENIHMPQLGTALPGDHITNNQIVQRNSAVAHSAFNRIDQQAYPSLSALIQQNSVDAAAGILLGTGTLNSGKFMGNQQHSKIWNSSRPQYHHCPAPNVWAHNVYDSKYAPNYMHYDTSVIHRPHQFNAPPQQAGHFSGLQKIFDVQNCMLPSCPTFPRPESYSNYQPAFAPMPPNAYDRQHVYRPMPPESVLPTGPAIFYDYHPPNRPSGMTYNSFGAGPSMPTRYPQLQDYQRNPFQSQTLMPNGFAQRGLGSPQLSGSPRVSDNRNEQSQLWSSPSSIVRAATILSRLAGSSVQSSRVPETSRLNEASNVQNSRVSWTQKSTGVQLQNVVPAAPNTATSQINRGKVVNPSSSLSPPISEEVRKILDRTAKHKGPKTKAISSARRTNAHHIQTPDSQDSDETWIKELEKELNRAWNQPDTVTKNQEQAASGRRRSPRTPEVGESSSSSKRQKRGSAGKERVETPPNSDEARNTSENEGNEDRDDNTSDPSPAREILNSVYDKRFEMIGLPIDPHIRFFKTAGK